MNNLSKEKISMIISRLLEKDITKFSYNANLQNEFGMDSIILIELIVELETVFDIEIRDEDLLLENFENINSIYSTLLSY